MCPGLLTAAGAFLFGVSPGEFKSAGTSAMFENEVIPP